MPNFLALAIDHVEEVNVVVQLCRLSDDVVFNSVVDRWYPFLGGHTLDILHEFCVKVTILLRSLGGDGDSIVVMDIGAIIDFRPSTVLHIQHCTRGTLLDVMLNCRLSYQWTIDVRLNVFR